METVKGDGVEWLTDTDRSALDAKAERLVAAGHTVSSRIAHVVVTCNGQTAHHYNRLVALSGERWRDHGRAPVWLSLSRLHRDPRATA